MQLNDPTPLLRRRWLPSHGPSGPRPMAALRWPARVRWPPDHFPGASPLIDAAPNLLRTCRGSYRAGDRRRPMTDADRAELEHRQEERLALPSEPHQRIGPLSGLPSRPVHSVMAWR